MRIVPRHIRYQQRMDDIAKVVHIIETTGVREADAGTGRTRNTAADARVLRMIPVVAEGVGGRIPGTNPMQEVIDAEARAARHNVRSAA